ncbi:MAG: mechanosensitive ion channel, partial [Sulfurimonas sp.]|nr:mechanosensitive ion channel [Sulfurimonas sp.]
MKIFIFLLLFSIWLFCGSIDEKLFEGANKELYYKEIQKQINNTPIGGKRLPELVDEEKLQLSRVRGAASQTIVIESYDLSKISKNQVEIENYYDALNGDAAIRNSINEHQQMLVNIQSKLAFIKQKIANLVEEDKEKLLSYQLQFAYYKLQQKNIETKTELLQKHEKEIFQQLLRSLQFVQCDKLTLIEEKLLLHDNKIKDSTQEKIALQISLENALIAESEAKDVISKKIKNAESEQQKLLMQKIMLKTEQSICMIQNENNQDYFKSLIDIEGLSLSLASDIRPVYKEQISALRDLSKEAFGVTKLFFGATLHETKEVLKIVIGYISSPLFVFNERSISIFSLIKALILIILGFIVGFFYNRWITRTAKRWANSSQMAVRLITNMGYYFIILISFIIAFSSIGIDMSSMSLIAGALSIGIGFGLQTVVSNFIAGVILMFERTIRIGDVVQISDSLRGRVTDMRIRSTTIKTFDNIDIIVPNSSFIQNNVINLTLEDLSRRLHVPFSVAYGTKIELVKATVLDELENSGLVYVKN